MALTFRLEDNLATETVDLISDSVRLVKDGWTSYPEGGFVTETFTLRVKGANRAAARAALNGVITRLEEARRFHATGIDADSIWLRHVTDGETAKRALIYDYSLTPLSRGGITQSLDLNDGTISFWQLAITRDREWEAVTDTTVTTTDISGMGGKWDLTATTGGHVDGRITSLKLSDFAGGTNKIWCGIHNPRIGVEFDNDRWSPVLNLDDIYTGSDTTVVSSGGGLSGNVVETTFATVPDWAFRAYSLLHDNSPSDVAHARSNIGRWLVLLRARVESATEVMVRATLSGGEADYTTTRLNQGPPVFISHTFDRLYEMGEIQLPMWGWRASSFPETMKQVRLNLEARRVSGTGKLIADAFILIPAEHMFVWTGATVDTAASGDVGAYVETQEDGRIVGVVVSGSEPSETVESIAAVTARDWRFPKEGGVLVIAMERSANGGSTVLTDTCDLSLTMRERWLGYAD